jgi:hypothetical protein
VRLSRCFRANGRRRGGRQARVARLTDLDAAVGDELGDDEADGSGDGRARERSCRCDGGAGPGRPSRRSRARPPHRSFAARESAQNEDRHRSQPLRGRLPGTHAESSRLPQAPQQRRAHLLDAASHRPVHLAGALCGRRGHRADAPARRCYHRASLRQSFRRRFRSSFGRAREGLFHAPISALARSFAFVPSLFHD